jgi:DNA-binding transcriptional ArsR family regulator/uncharacterized protein YndB with AHSA1/START domain
MFSIYVTIRSHMEEELTPIWRALLDPHRRAILDLLKERPRTTGELCTAFTVSRFAVMKHLTVLEEARLVIVKRKGRERWNYLNAVPIQQMYERWLKPYEAHVAASLLRMKQLVETDEEREHSMSEQSASGISLFHTELEVPIKASPERIYQALTRDIAEWWDADASWGRGKLVLEPEVGKRMWEDFGNGEGALFGIVTYVEHNKKLEIEGDHGLGSGVQGYIRLELVPQEEGTLLKFSHRAFGEISERSRQRFPEGWKQLLTVNLPQYLERNK